MRNLLIIPLTAVTAGFPYLAQADNNAIIVTQSAPDTLSVGNTLIIDQSLADDSVVSGVLVSNPVIVPPVAATTGPAADAPLALVNIPLEFDTSGGALQTGSGNTGNITVSGTGGRAGLLQDGSSNSAIIVSGGDFATTLVAQFGSGNSGNLTIAGSSAFGGLLQNGDSNTGSVSVEGRDAGGILAQIGDGNQTELSVSALDNAVVSYTVEGNNVSSVVPANVFSTGGGAVTIVQRSITTP
ncbi:hypothetical protein [Cognatishimia sp. F0-27]|uniref:hypothetical protein n=1 Tax=Cognatishimia sp. F0-27 TaxID=2816855 RepID=UPI001D0C0951|nr:hypothetical protein [Cognatishimia sp. F0-27]MCC1494652.1 hypothetical protein [Cognatishimia sp. F0-27]